MNEARWEYGVLAILLLVLLTGVTVSGWQARAERRDGIRRAELIELKRELEMYFNQQEKYPLEFDAKPHDYVVVESDGEQALGWYVRGQLERRPEPTAGFDYEYNIYFRVTERGEYDICGGAFNCGV